MSLQVFSLRVQGAEVAWFFCLCSTTSSITLDLPSLTFLSSPRAKRAYGHPMKGEGSDEITSTPDS